jgi:hypothetical protein
MADGWQLRHGTDQVRVSIESSRPIALDCHKAAVHPSYGLHVETIRLVWRYTGPLPLRVATHVTGGTEAESPDRLSAPRCETRHTTIHGQHPLSMPVNGNSAPALAQRACKEA